MSVCFFFFLIFAVKISQEDQRRFKNTCSPFDSELNVIFELSLWVLFSAYLIVNINIIKRRKIPKHDEYSSIIVQNV